MDRGLAEPGALTIETGAGVISVDIGDDDRAPWITMTQNRPEFGPQVPTVVCLGLDGHSARRGWSPPGCRSA
ncbi:MAG: hypothetical protein ACE368_06365 [Paracoccaceae bacterium]